MKNPIIDILNAKKKLELSEIKFQTVAQTATDSIVIADQNSIILFSNKKTEEVFGYNEEELIGKNLNMLMPEKYSEGHRKGVERFIATSTPKLMGQTIELEGLRKNSSVFPLELSLSFWKENNEYFFTGIIRDITERKKALQEIELLQTITDAVSEAKDFNTALAVTIKKVCLASGWDYGEAWIQGEDKDTIQYAPVWYASNDTNLLEFLEGSKKLTLRPGEGMPGRVYQGDTEWVADVSNNSGFLRKKLAQKAGLKAGLGVPIIADKKVLAAVLFYMTEPREEDIYLTKMVASVAKQLGSVFQRKKTEEALKTSEEKYRLIAKNSSDVISVHALDGVILYISPSCEIILGYKPEELVGINAHSLYHPEDLVKMGKAYGEVVKLPDIYTVTFRFRKKDGSYIWFESTARTIKDEQGNPLEIHASNRDVTERKTAEDKLKESEYFIKSITDSSPAIITVYDLINSVSIYANKELTDFLGYTTEEIRAMGKEAMNMIIHPDDIVKAVDRNKKLSEMKDGEIVETEIRVRNSEGNYRWLYTKTVLFKRTKEGKVWQTLSTSLDITDKKQAEEELKKAKEELVLFNRQLEEKVNIRTEELNHATENLKQSENQLRIITNTLPAFISYIDKNEKYLYANGFYANLSFITESPVRKHVKEVLGEDIYNLNKKFIEKALQGVPSAFINQVSLKDGSIKEVEVKYTPDIDEKGTVRGFVVMGIDLTERVNFERELGRKNNELERINNDLDNFIYTASHDLKAPISNIEGLISAIQTSETYSKIPQEIKDLLSMIDTSVEKFKHTIIDLTEISKAQKSLEEGAEDIDVSEVIDETEFLVKDLIKSSNARIRTNLKVPKIKFSKRNFRSILYNLLSNALKYRSLERIPEIEIRTEASDGYTILSVKDNGLGIGADKTSKIFMMFKRMHSHIEGTGVGLYIVKRIVDNSGGKIEVESEAGKGSIFKVYLKN